MVLPNGLVCLGLCRLENGGRRWITCRLAVSGLLGDCQRLAAISMFNLRLLVSEPMTDSHRHRINKFATFVGSVSRRRLQRDRQSASGDDSYKTVGGMQLVHV
jgi:hypothetical protein